MNSSIEMGLRDARRQPSSDIALVGIYEISKILTAPAPLERTLASVVNVLSSFLHMHLGMIVILDSEGVPEIVATSGWAGGTKGRPIETLPQPVIDRLVATATPMVVQDIAQEPLFEEAVDLITETVDGRALFIGVPIRVHDHVGGTLTIARGWTAGRSFRIDDDLRFLTMVANLVGQTIRLHKMLAAERQRLLEERRAFEKALDQELAEKSRIPAPKIQGIVGESPSIRRVMETIATVARSNSTVLLRGESGTGKELFGRAIHELSPRKAKPFVKLNCAALPESVLESELFGHEKGAFTGALAQRAGRFEMAHGGTLLLDEIGEISASFQAKLLRVLQEGEFERVGGNRTLKVDVRLICATNKDLEAAVAKGEFRADLYYRINVVPVFLPPLRERPGDIALLASSFLDRFNTENGRKLAMSNGAMDVLKHCHFPGNVRELENCVRRTATLAKGPIIVRDDMACNSGSCLSALLWTPSGHRTADSAIADLASGGVVTASVARIAPRPAPPEAPVASRSADSSGYATGPARTPAAAADPGNDSGFPASGLLADRDALISAMERSGWVQAKAARLLGLTPRQIGYALKKYRIEVQRF